MRSADHLTFAPTLSFTDFSQPEYLMYGMQIRNLTALQVLDLIRSEISEPTASATLMPSVTPTPRAVPVYEAGQTMVSPGDGMKLVYVPAGSFEMGSASGNPDQAPVHTVQLDGYWLDQTEVTNAMYARFLASMGNRTEGGIPWLNPLNPFVWIQEKDGAWQALPGRETYPVVGLSWYGANAYCAWAGRQLPTEAQWEYAAKGTDQRRFPWGNDDLDCDRARYSGCGNIPVEAGSLAPGQSPVGAFDLAGNVAEWVNDRYAADYYLESPQKNPSGPSNGYYRVLRGGYWGSTYIALQTAYRDWAGADQRESGVGFRCALNP
jgi:serine/threonine-protein kinase